MSTTKIISLVNQMTPGVPSNTSVGRTTLLIGTDSSQMKCLGELQGKPDHALLSYFALFALYKMVTKPLYLYLVLPFAFRCFCYFCSRRGKVASELGRNYRLDGENIGQTTYMPLRFRKCHVYYYFYYKRLTN